MAQCKLSPQEFIKDAFTPQVAAMCTPGVQRCCDKNNLDFIEILEPFSTLTNDGLEKVEHLPDPWSQFLNSRIDLKNYQLSPSSSPDPKRHDSFEIGQEANETRNITYHPLSPELENILTDMQFEKEEPMIKQNTEKWRHGGCLSANDVEQIKTMLNEFVKVCLLPYIEKHLSLLHDAATNKKGVSKSLLSATKRWFGSGKPNSNSLAANNLTYSVDAPELQIRRLGDLYFMFGNYSAAFQAYHTAKRDYNADQAWLYYAGALEMAALSAFMANESSRKTYDYMEESIATYLTTCKLPQFATRATILSSECLKAKQLYGETAHQLIRMTSEDSDLRSALFLEQASCCFIQSNMLRKYAFHMVLSGHRFFKAAQKKHSLRCYKQAYQIYEKTGWDLASDHIHYTIGRLANHLQIFDEAVKSFAKLLNGESKQSGLQQGIFLKEYLTILELKRKDDGLNELPILPVPELNNAVIKVLVGPARPLSTPGKVPALGIHFTGCENSTVEERWHKLEELLLSEESGKAPVVFKPVVTLRTARSTDTNTLLAIINEPIQVSIQLINSLQTVLQLKDLYLIWCYENDKKSVTNLESNDDVDKYMKTYVTKSVVIQGNSRQDLILSLTPVATGDVFLSGQLESGQSISFYIWVKAPPVKGPSSIDLLAYYENVDSQRIPKYRLIRHTWNLSVQESITVDISTQNSYTSTTAEDLALALKTTNLNQIHNSISTEITLLNIALLSNNWVLTQDIVTPKYINLKAQESAHILIKARRKVSKSCKQTNLSLNSEKTTLPHLSTAFQAFARKSHVPELNIFELNSENDKREGTLILEWRALVCDASNRRIVYGHTCVPIEINRKEHHLETLISESIIDLNSLTTHESDYLYTSQNLVTYNLFYSAVVRHNFKKKVSCVVPITLVIHSVADKKITITISTIASSMVSCNTHNRSTKSCLTSSQATSNFSWLTNGKVVRILEPLTTIAVKLSAIIANPGTFDLGANLLVFCNSLVHDDVPVLQRNQATSSLIVIDGGS
ncbi:hypothetical protein HUJ04_012829 [Dendroctonus ponderosae]|nr:hypothetical protein HUJ04_012829 [Dendroctonus ponderosae]